LEANQLLELAKAVGAFLEVLEHAGDSTRIQFVVEKTLEGFSPAGPVEASHAAETPCSSRSFPTSHPLRPSELIVSQRMSEPVVDQKAQKEAFDRYVVPEIEVLYRVARSITRNPTDAEDLVQDTMLRAYRAILRFDGRHPRAWLLTIMRNAQINRVRRKRPELLRDPDAAMERLADEDSADLGPEAQVVDSGYEAAVEKAVDALPEKFRSVIELVDIQGLSYAEAAEIIGVPTGTVMSRLHRARTRIRRQLESSGAYVNGRPT
jgi:RNA polymerase sigma-70 factor (ECF subfamily)